MAVQTGQQAPDFTLPTSDTQRWALAEHRGNPVVLLFFPGAFTSVCTDELNAVSNTLDDYTGSGAEVVGISTDSPFAQAEFKKANDLKMTLLSDHDASVSERFGAKYDHDFTDMNLDRISKRAAFVIDGDGTVRYAEVLENAGKQPDLDAVKRTLRELG